MSELQRPFAAPRLIVLENQPGFPDEDLTTPNAGFVSYQLTATHAERAHAVSLGENLVPLFRIGHEALQIRDLPTEDSRVSYEAFRDGFAAAEYAMTIVRQRIYSGDRAVGHTRELLRAGAAAPNRLADDYHGWLNDFPNTFGVIADVSIDRGDTIKQSQARCIGACVATAFQREALFVA